MKHKLSKSLSRFLLLACLLLGGISQAWGEVVSGTEYSTINGSFPSEWTDKSSALENKYATLYKDAYIQTDAFCQNGFTSIVINGRTVGGSSSGTNELYAIWVDEATSTETELGKVTYTSTTIKAATINSFLATPSKNTSGYIKLVCKGATASKGCGVAKVKITYTNGICTQVPIINASDVTLEADATSGEIAYTISNPAEGVNPTAVLTTGDWISNVQVDAANKKVTFEAAENTTAAARTASIKISYTDAEDKTVTITQKKPFVTTAYNKVTASTMVIGGTYVWYANKKVSAPMSGTNKYFSAADATLENNQVKVTSEVSTQEFIFNQTESGWTIQNSSNKYLQVSGDKQLSWVDGSVNWIMEGTTDPTFKSYRDNTTTYYKMQFNSDRFNVYTSNQTAATLYHLASESAHTLSLVIDGETTKTYNIKDGYTWKLPTIDDDDFLGWATTPNGGVVYANGAAYAMPSDDATLYAKRRVETQTVYLVDNNNIWQTASAKFAVYYGEGESFTNGGWSEFMTEDCATNHVYSVEIPETATYVSFKRLASDAETPATGTVWTDAGNHALDNGKACWVYSDNGTWKYSYNASPYYSIAGNGGADATKAWMNGENWEPVSLGCDNYVTFVNVPAGNWTLKSIDQNGTWNNAISANNTAKNVALTNDKDQNIILYTDRAQDITISYDNGLKFVGTFGYYTVAGAEALTGENWNYASETNRMTWDAEKSLYVLTKTNVSLATGDYEYRVGVNGTHNPQYPSEYNASTNIAEDGIYNVTFTYNPSDDAVAVNCAKMVPSVTPSTGSVNVHSEKNAQGTATFTITGENVTGDLTLSFADEVDGLTVSPTTIEYTSATLASTTITVSYQSTEETSGSTTLNIKQGESVLSSVTINYTSTKFFTDITDVTGAMTWDFSGYTEDVKLTDVATEVVLANYVDLTTGDASMLKGKQQYIVRSKYCWQGTQLTFHPTVPGTITVVWSSTASNNYRTLAIGDEKIVAAGSNSTSASGGVTTTRVVPANQDVVLTGWNVSGTAPNYEYTSNQIRIWSLKFTPAVTVSTAQYATYYHADYSYVMPEGLEGIVVSAQTGTALTLDVMYTADGANGTEKVVPAGEPLILHATTNLTSDETFVLEPGTTTQSSCKELDMNLLSGTSAADEETTGGAPYYRLSVHGGKVGFYWGAEGGAAFKPGANKAYLALNGASAPDRFVFNPSTPIVTGVDETLNKYVKSGKTLVNGKLYIVRENKVFDLNGRLVK